MKKLLTYFIAMAMLLACSKNDAELDEPQTYVYSSLERVTELEQLLDSLANLKNPAQREQDFEQLWDSLIANNEVPFVRDDTVLFLLKGSATSIKYAGDFNGWNPNEVGYASTLIDSLSVWKLKKHFPSDARLDYKLVVNGNNWRIDPHNPYTQYSGFGANSELRMGKWEPDPITFPIDGARLGDLSTWQIIQSTNLGYKVQYKVYLPYNYANLSDLPVIYITDGHEYSDSRLGNAVRVLDNLIYTGSIEPIIAVFVDPRNPDNMGQNRRMEEYAGNQKFSDFLADELVSLINSSYRTTHKAAKTALMGTSMGGWITTHTGFSRWDVFNLLAIHSPAYREQTIFDLVENSEVLPLKLFMSTGTINDTKHYADPMKVLFDAKGYPLNYIEVNEGHSWGNWKALLDEPLIQFYGIKEN